MSTCRVVPVSVEQVVAEARAVAAFQRLDRGAIDQALDELRPYLERYAEISLTEHGFEILTGEKGPGAAAALGDLARRRGSSTAVVDQFLACDARFPDRMLGLKVCFGRGAKPPTLYHRTLAPKEDALAFLASLPGMGPALSSLRRRLEANLTIYGLAFIPSGGELGVKVYTIGDVPSDLGGHAPGGPDRVDGFVSYRLSGGRTHLEVKRYLTDVAWDRLSFDRERWQSIVEFAKSTLGYEQAGYFGLLETDGDLPELKLYIERVGAIPTEYAAR